MGFKNVWLNSCFGTTQSEVIEATFKSGEKVNYTTDILNLLQTDSSVIEIVSLETGELYKWTGNDGTTHTAYPE